MAEIDPKTGERIGSQQIDPQTGERMASVAGAGSLGTPQPAAHPAVTMNDPSFDAQTQINPNDPLTLKGLKSVVGTIGAPFAHPLKTISGLIPQDYATQYAEAQKQPKQDLASGLVTGAGQTFGGLALGAALGGAAKVGAPLLEKIPTRARAGSVFQSVMQDAKDQPVNLTNSGDQLLRVQELAQRGTSMPQAAGKLLRRTTEPNSPPLTYAEARDFASNLSRSSVNESQRLSPVMQANIGKLSRAFNQDIQDTAGSVGRGEDYAQAMKDYARAAKTRELITKTAKWAVPAAIGGGVLSKVIGSTVPSK